MICFLCGLEVFAWIGRITRLRAHDACLKTLAEDMAKIAVEEEKQLDLIRESEEVVG